MPLFGTDKRLMIQNFPSNLAIVDLVKGLWNDQKLWDYVTIFDRREGIRLQTKMSHFFMSQSAQNDFVRRRFIDWAIGLSVDFYL